MLGFDKNKAIREDKEQKEAEERTSEDEDEEEKEEEKTEEDINLRRANFVSETENELIFLKVVEVASAARCASRLADEATARHRRLIELTRSTEAEARAMREIALSLSQVASLVTRGALQLCRLTGCQDTFERHPTISSQVNDLENFLEMNDGGSLSLDLLTTKDLRTKDSATSGVSTMNTSTNDATAPQMMMMHQEDGTGYRFDRDYDVSPGLLQHGFVSSISPTRSPFHSSSFSCISVSSSSMDSGARSESRFSGRGFSELVCSKQKSSPVNPSTPLLLSQNASKLVPVTIDADCLMKVSSDTEMVELLEPKPVESPTIQKLRAFEHRTTDSIDAEMLMNTPKQRVSQEKQSIKRPISPLLVNAEKDNYAVSKEDTNSTNSKHIYTPPASVISSLERIEQTRSEAS